MIYIIYIAAYTWSISMPLGSENSNIKKDTMMLKSCDITANIIEIINANHSGVFNLTKRYTDSHECNAESNKKYELRL